MNAIEPSNELAQWAEGTGEFICPQDRPWYFVNMLVFNRESNHMRHKCHCEHTNVTLTRFPCEDDTQTVFIGQCARCQAIIWSCGKH